MENFVVRFAELNVKILCVSPKIKFFCEDFLVENAEHIDITITSSMDNARKLFKKGEGSLEYSEMLDVFRKIAEELPKFNRCVFHGASIKYKENGIIFCAESGVGKTTHISLWQKNLNKVEVINGDKPVLWIKYGGVYACGNPWRGKEGLGGKIIQKVTSFCFLERGKDNSIQKIEKDEELKLLLKQIYLPSEENAMQKTFDFLEELVKIPAYRLKCNIHDDAFKVAFNKLVKREN